MQRYHDPIAVKVGQGPMQFIWRGRLLLVKEIQAQWNRSLQWWTIPEITGDLVAEQEVWRVEAGNEVSRGVYELAHPVGGTDWFLTAVCD